MTSALKLVLQIAGVVDVPIKDDPDRAVLGAAPRDSSMKLSRVWTRVASGHN
jgi:hypothetical protein